MSLKYVEGKIIVSCDLEKKNSHTFSHGQVIRIERKYNEFNRRITEPTNATVISAEHIPEGSEVLLSHNSLHDTNKIFNYESFSGQSQASDIKYFSVPEYECYAWREPGGEFKPMKGYQFGLRVFKPYLGVLTGIEPETIKDVLYATTGDLKGKIVHTVKSADYEIVFQGDDGKEANIIRFRHSDDEELDREEVIAIDHNLTEQYDNGELLIGIDLKTAKTKIEYA